MKRVLRTRRVLTSAFLLLPFALSRAGVEAVADPGFGEDVARAGRVGFDLLAQLADEDAQVFGLLDALAAPDRREQRAVRENLAGVVQEVDEQLEILRREPHVRAADDDRARFQ